MYKIGFYVPVENAENVKRAMFSVGAGKFNNYDCCCFEYEGVGQFRPLSGSSPFVGKFNEIEKVKELRVEMIVSDDCVKNTIKAMKDTHPYEEVAYDVLKLEEL